MGSDNKIWINMTGLDTCLNGEVTYLGHRSLVFFGSSNYEYVLLPKIINNSHCYY